jgi:hypothetical protein
MFLPFRRYEFALQREIDLRVDFPAPGIVPHKVRRKQVVDPLQIPLMPNLFPRAISQQFVVSR